MPRTTELYTRRNTRDIVGLVRKDLPLHQSVNLNPGQRVTGSTETRTALHLSSRYWWNGGGRQTASRDIVGTSSATAHTADFPFDISHRQLSQRDTGSWEQNRPRHPTINGCWVARKCFLCVVY